MLAEGLQDRAGTGRVAGVGLQATEQGREHGRRGGAHLVGGGADLLRDLVGGQGAEDVVDCGHEGPFPAGGPAPHLAANLAPGCAQATRAGRDTGPGMGA